MANATFPLVNLTKESSSKSTFAVGDTTATLTLLFGGIGIIMNFFIFAIMSLKNLGISPATDILFRNQLMLDGCACAILQINLIYIFLLPTWDTVPYALNCVLIKQAMLVWIFYCASAYNTVAVAIQRFIGTHFPLATMTKLHGYIIISIVFVLATSVNLLNYGLEMEIVPWNNICIYKYTSLFANASWITLYYLMPVILTIFLYAKVFLKLRSNDGVVKKTKSKRIDSLLLKNAVVISAMYIICSAPNSFAYFLTPFGVVDPAFQRTVLVYLTRTFTLINSASTPFVYLIFVTAIRKECYKTLCCNKVAPANDTRDTTLKSKDETEC